MSSTQTNNTQKSRVSASKGKLPTAKITPTEILNDENGQVKTQIHNEEVVSASTEGKKQEATPKTPKTPKTPSAKATNFITVNTEFSKAAILGNLSDLHSSNMHDKIGSFLNEYVQTYVEFVQDNKLENQEDPFPITKYKHSSEKVTKKEVETTSQSANKTLSVPFSYKTADGTIVTMENNSTSKVQSNESNNDDTTGQENSEKKNERKNITIVGRDAKAYLNFVIGRFIYEVITLIMVQRDQTDNIIKKLGNMARSSLSLEILNFPNKVISSEDGFMYNTVIPIAERYYETVTNAHGSTVEQENLSKNLESKISNFTSRFPNINSQQSLVSYLTNISMTYLKVIALGCSKKIWIAPSAINSTVIETVMRITEIGNYEWLKSKECSNAFITVNGCEIINDATRGLYKYMVKYENDLYPPQVKESKGKSKKTDTPGNTEIISKKVTVVTDSDEGDNDKVNGHSN